MRLALAQIDTVVGDLDGNPERIVRRIHEARTAGVDVVIFPELAVTGYPPEDLLLRPGFLRAAARSLEKIARETKGIAALVGAPLLDRDLFNACAVCVDGEVKGWYRKRFLPNYGVFDEGRYFQAGRDLLLLRCGETLVGPTVCEDIWQPGPPSSHSSRRSSTRSSRCGSRSSSACGTTPRRMAFGRSCSASPAGSTRRSRRHWRPRRWGRSASTASRCRPATARRGPAPTQS